MAKKIQPDQKETVGAQVEILKSAKLGRKHGKHPHRAVQLTTLAKEMAVPRVTIVLWEKHGMPTTSVADAVKWAMANKSSYFAGGDQTTDPATWSKSTWDREKARWSALRLKFEFQKADGSVHDKAACTASLVELRIRESKVLNELGDRFLSAFPEAASQASWIRKETEGVIERLRSKLPSPEGDGFSHEPKP